MQKKSLKLNLIMNMLLTVSGVIFPLITFPYVTRILQPEGTGKIAFANSIIAYFSMIAMLGIPTYGIRACAKVRDDRDMLSKTVQEIWLIHFGTTVIAYFLLAVALLCVPKLRQEKTLLLISSISIFLNLIAVEWLYKALECYSYITLRSLFFKVVALILMFLMVKRKEDYLIYAGIVVLANTGYGIFNVFNLRKCISWRKQSEYQIKKHIKPILVFFAMTVAITIYTNLDVTMLGFLKNDQEVGCYDVAIKIKSTLVSIITSLGAVLLPRTSYYVEKNMKKEFMDVSAKAMRFVILLSLPLVISFSILARPCILLLSGEAYLNAVQPMIVIMPTLLLIGLSNLFGIQMLVPLGKEKTVLQSVCAGAAIDVVINAILIPKYGAAGAAFGTVMAEFTVLLVQIVALKSYIWKIAGQLQIEKIGIAAGIAAAGLWYVNVGFQNMTKLILPTRVAVSFTIYFGVYVGMLLAVKERTMMELVEMLKNLRKSTSAR